ncbi:hypothetical protein HK18_07535 [Commensalibacter intestini]|uniref:Uncharacterized protein n=1 Tax=Commensalibacter intestini TaxID=479936 RepID=A0A251ZVM5_9PROT|nr:hypothetical protein HK18_07535 [Commensalibacter intestini]
MSGQVVLIIMLHPQRHAQYDEIDQHISALETDSYVYILGLKKQFYNLVGNIFLTLKQLLFFLFHQRLNSHNKSQEQMLSTLALINDV